MYGANYTTHNGATFYRWDPLTGEMSIGEGGGGFVGQGRPGGAAAPAEANRVFLTVWDGGGADTYDLSNYATSVSIDLRPGQWSVTAQNQLAVLDANAAVDPGTHVARGNVFNALLYNGDTRSYVENGIGGAGDDTLTGNDVANSLTGGTGTDTMYGGIGDDVLFGGAAGAGVSNWLHGDGGMDTASYTGTVGVVYGDLNTHGGLVAGVLTDYYAAIKNLTGGEGNDSLVGDGLANALRGGAGDDLLFGGDGDDTLIGGGFAGAGFNQLFGGNGNDLVDYGTETGRVFVDLRAPAGYIDGGSGFVLNDLMNSVENATGGSGNDTLVGTDGTNTLSGGGGSDVLVGLDGGDLLFGGAIASGSYNQLFGGTGTDTASYAGETVKVTADLEGLYGYVGGIAPAGLRDVFNSIENLVGGSGNDLLAGDSATNIIDGGAGSGNDTLWGRGGNDTLTGGAGNDLLLGNDGLDTLVGGAGADRFFFFGTETGGADSITDFASTEGDRIYVVPGAFGTYTSGQPVAFFGGTGGSNAIFGAHVAQGFAYDTATGALYFDADGSAAGSAAIQLPTLVNLATLAGSDIVVF